MTLRHLHISNQNLISHSQPDDSSGASLEVAIGAGNGKFDSVKGKVFKFSIVPLVEGESEMANMMLALVIIVPLSLQARHDQLYGAPSVLNSESLQVFESST